MLKNVIEELKILSNIKKLQQYFKTSNVKPALNGYKDEFNKIFFILSSKIELYSLCLVVLY